MAANTNTDHSQKGLTQVSSSGKQNKSFVVGPKNSLPPTAQNSLLNATLMAMINQKQGGKSQSRSKSKSGANAYQIGKKSVGRAKSACKGKVELFNSTAPIKFFSNLEETVREITTLNGAGNLKIGSGTSTKLSNRPGGKGTKHHAVKDHHAVYSGNTTTTEAEHRKMMQSGNTSAKAGSGTGHYSQHRQPGQSSSTIHSKRKANNNDPVSK